jgi:plasmid maintenance system antidote protein VapI
MNYSYQRSLPLLANIKREPEILPERLEYLLDDIKTPAQAILFSIQRAGRTQTVVGEEMGLVKSHWSGIVNGTKNMSLATWLKLRQLLNNDFYLQWMAWTAGYRLVRREPSEQEKVAEENEQLRAEVERLRANQRP